MFTYGTIPASRVGRTAAVGFVEMSLSVVVVVEVVIGRLCVLPLGLFGGDGDGVGRMILPVVCGGVDVIWGGC